VRAPEDMPRRRGSRFSRLSGRGRIILLVVAVLLFVLFTSLRGIAGFYTDYLWFDSLELSSVWTGILGTRVALAVVFTAIFFAVAFANLTVADRLAPKFRPSGPEDDLLSRYHQVVDRRAGLVRAGVSLVFALIAGVGVSAQWNQWLLFRHGGNFGTNDAIFDTDVGFYVFKLPFITSVIDWAFASMVIIILITIVAHYLNGGIRLQSPFQRVTPRVKAHVSVLLAALALIKAVDYWFGRYELTFSARGHVDGAGYTDVQAQLPATYLLLMISLLSCALFIVNIWRRGWVLPVVAVGLWGFVQVMAGAVYPTFIQRVVVEPQESTREAEYIGYNIEATREAMALSDVEVRPFPYTADVDVGAEAIEANRDTIRNVRLLDPDVVLPTYNRLQASRGYYRFNELDVDRYPIIPPEGDEPVPTQVVLANRDLNSGDLPQQSWEGRHLVYTHGYGLALSAANATTPTGQPDFLIQDVPVLERDRIDLNIERPQLYFGESLPGYAIVGTTRDEVDYLDPDGTPVPYNYTGTGGVGMDSWLRRGAFFLRFNFDWNMLFSNFITSESRILYIRDVRERFEAAAPFMRFDADPYPVVVNGRIVYMIDGYTTTDRYPNAQRAETNGLPSESGLNGHRFNYIRNSVKGVLDAYDGTVKLYVVDPDDPIVNAYRSAFPALFADESALPQELREHYRYPEDLFRVQTGMFGRYHLTEVQAFYDQTNGWLVAQDPGRTVQRAAANVTPATTPTGQVVRQQAQRINPVYVNMSPPGEDRQRFVMLRSFVPFSDDDSNQRLTAFMVAHSDPDDYGRMVVYEMPSDLPAEGPALINATIQANEDVAQRVTLLDQQGSTVSYGDLMLVPITAPPSDDEEQGESTILYVRPMYVAAQGAGGVPVLTNVIVVHGTEVVMESTLAAAIERLFEVEVDTFEADIIIDPTVPPDGESPDEGTTTTTAPTTTQPPAAEGEPSERAQTLLDEAAQLFADADRELRENGADGLAAYQRMVLEAADKVAEAQRLLSTTVTTTTQPAAGA
jgi:uncharacterized protein